MSKQHRTRLIKSLEQQLEEATDPKIKADISRQLTKLLFKPSRKGSSRKPQAETPSTKNGLSAIVAKWATRLSHVQPEAERIELSVILECEEKGRSRGVKFDPPSTESRALLTEVMGMLSEEERALLPQKSTFAFVSPTTD